jgi:hypothetical protein
VRPTPGLALRARAGDIHDIAHPALSISDAALDGGFLATGSPPVCFPMRHAVGRRCISGEGYSLSVCCKLSPLWRVPHQQCRR